MSVTFLGVRLTSAIGEALQVIRVGYVSRFACPYDGTPLRAQWWRRLGHRFRVPIFGMFYIGRIVELLSGTGGGPGEDEIVRKYFFIECKRCHNKIPVPEKE